MVLNSYMLTSWWIQMIYCVGTIATGQVHAIFLRITKLWHELSKSKVNNPPGFFLNDKIAYTVLNVMLTTIKIS